MCCRLTVYLFEQHACHIAYAKGVLNSLGMTSYQDAEDAVSNTYAKCIAKWPADAKIVPGMTDAWARKILYNECMNLGRTRGRRRERDDDALQTTTAPAQPDVVLQQEQRDKLAQALAQLTPEEQEFVRLRYYEKMSYDEISAKMARPKPFLYELNRRVLAKLRSQMDD
ncbi:MAG: sigma-70 family RNA polymerase sigma factor [Planctomycetales bacterium]|nr:sigma-70 family RNA polymerase sigma factor [Planctomycetales bacterium]